MLKKETLNSDIKTYEVLLKIACAAKLNLVRSLIWLRILRQRLSDKITRKRGGNCWGHGHVVKRIGSALRIPVERKTKGTHIFLAYKLKSKEKKPVLFAFDPLFCETTGRCHHEFLDEKVDTEVKT